MKLDYFLNAVSLVKAVKDFFAAELAIELRGKQEQPLPVTSIFGKDFKRLEQIDKLYFPGGISDETFKSGEVSNWDDLNKQAKYKALFVFAVELKEKSPTRTLLSDITRKLNRVSEGAPVIVLFKYDSKLSLATCERTAKEKGTGEKVGKVSLLKDIDLQKPHAGHLRILTDLRIITGGKKVITTFEQLYQHWRAVFNLQVLNEKFYLELFYWYLWALRLIKIPPKPEGEKLDEGTLKSIFVIRLITRLMFVWFVKEKKLVEEKLFDEDNLKMVLKRFNSNAEDASVYYRAILQNLFFATLNTPLRKEAKDEHETRRFIDLVKKGNKGYSDGYTDQTLYRYEDYFKDSKKGLELFDTIPFLNGGLFECLDFPENKATGERERRYDGFSSVREKQAFVPDVLFFGGDTELDITKDLEVESKKGKIVKRLVRVRGLAHTLKDYKFTITENTPLEEEIALDPELLGKVFENLLASYNPETKATARKQTGSFYTPREIVNYMVDESLKAYLLPRLSEGSNAYVEMGRKQTQMFGNEVRKGQTALLQEISVDEERKKKCSQKLENLFQYTVETNPFNEADTALLIRAISDCRILDPACGSGAFPMGILHRMVNVLAKLDPNNKRWKGELLRKAEEDLATAKKMGDEVIRAKATESAELRIQYIKDSFANNKHELDYTRKLFLIEHCIYGVDIQQIAVQIAKLRFFISLMVDQQVDDSKPNRNILSMPNLETKFVAANSLVGLDRNEGQYSLVDQYDEIVKKENELIELRELIFYTRRYRDKKNLQVKEQKLRGELKDLLIKNKYALSVAEQISGWNPFDPIHSASFFDPYTLFGFDDGFDVIIGNPPYIRIQNVEPSLKNYYSKKFVSSYKNYDLYLLFCERSLQLLKPGGSLLFIQMNKFFNSDYGEKFRELVTGKRWIKSIVDFQAEQMFTTATTYTCLFHCTKSRNNKFTYTWFTGDNKTDAFIDFSLGHENDSFHSEVYNPANFTKDQWSFGSASEQLLFSKIQRAGKPLSEICRVIFVGLQTSADPVYILEKTKDGYFSKYLDVTVRLENGLLKPLLKGAEIQRYYVNFQNLWIIFPYLVQEEGVKLITVKKLKSDYPLTWSYLNKCAKKLRGREDGKMDHAEWYAYVYPKNLEQFDQPKIMTQVLANKASMVFDENDGYHFVGGGNAGGYGIVLKNSAKIDYWYLLGLLNSSLLDFYLQHHSSRFQNNYFSYAKRFIENLPICEADKAKQSQIAKLTQKIQQLKIEDKPTFKQEKEIDLIVFKLYGFILQEAQQVDPDIVEGDWNNMK